MKRLIVALTATLALTAPAIAPATPPAAKHVTRYQHLYHQDQAKFGKRAPGRNIIRDGLSNGKQLTDAQLLRSIAVLLRMLAPPPAPVTVQSTASPVTSTGSVSAAPAGAGVPACASESGTNYSTGPANTNPSSGATGRYQILPSTAAAFGCSLATPAGQDACAQAIYARQGASAWVGCGG